MAILTSVPPPEQQDPSIPLTAFALSQLSIGQTTLRIPLDDVAEKPAAYGASKRVELQRDSQRRREALLKGEEGSRRRRRWESANFLNVPNSTPPLPSDWEPRPTYPVHTVPYYLAPLWEAGLRQHSAARHSAKSAAAAAAAVKTASTSSETKGKVPQELRTKLKKAKGAKTLLKGLESEIRGFATTSMMPPSHSTTAGPAISDTDSESETFSDSEEEIVFVGRDPHTGLPVTTSPPSSPASKRHADAKKKEVERQRKVYEGSLEAKEAGFARWLVHCLAEYYGLKSWSETVGEGRGVWVGLAEEVVEALPRPLWGLV